MTRVELSEWSRDGQCVLLDHETATVLGDTGLVEVCAGPDGSWRLLPLTNIVGAVRVGDLDVVVQPKARFSSVLFMLGYARDPGLRDSNIAGSADDDLWSTVAGTLARLGEEALRRGVLQGYVTRDEALMVVRGRVRVGDQIARRPGLVVPLEVRFDEFAADIAENQVLRAALHRLSHVPRVPHEVRRSLRRLAGRLDGVARLVPGAPLPVWRESRLNARYVPALRLAELVLRSVGLDTSAGRLPVASFVVNMATVFEDFVTVALREAFGREQGGRTDGQYRDHLDELRRVPIRPDVVHLVEGAPVAVLDAKYKLGYSTGGFPTADVYQVFAYCTALRLRRGWLVYAGSRAEGAQPQTHRVRGTDVDVVQWPLDVSAAPRDLLDQMDRLARDVRG